MAAVQTCTVPQPSRMNSAASRHVDDAADAGERQRGLGIGHDLLHHVQRDGLHRGAAVAAVGAFAVDIGARRERIEIDAGDGVDGVDGGQAIGAAALGRARHGANVA